MKQSIETRLSELEALISKDLKGVATFENGEKRRLKVVEIVLASLNGIKGNSSKITNIEWLDVDNGNNGIMPRLAEYLINGGLHETAINNKVGSN